MANYEQDKDTSCGCGRPFCHCVAWAQYVAHSNRGKANVNMETTITLELIDYLREVEQTGVEPVFKKLARTSFIAGAAFNVQSDAWT